MRFFPQCQPTSGEVAYAPRGEKPTPDSPSTKGLTMRMKCNIDEKGRVIRIAYGVILVLIGAILMIAALLRGGGWTTWMISIAALLLGAFAIFEGRAGWCVVRAMGIKTRI
jgi:hypothetical protein